MPTSTQESSGPRRRPEHGVGGVALFDRTTGCTYHCPIMPAPLRAWYSLRDVDALAARKAVMNGEIQLRDLTRLAGLVKGGTDAVDVRLSFETGGPGWQALELRYAVELAVVCQRCLEPMALRLEDTVRFGVVAEGSLEACLPEGVEPMVLDEDRLCPMRLIEDELIVSLPLVAKHEQNELCRQPDGAGGRHEPVNNEQKSRADAQTGSRSMNH